MSLRNKFISIFSKISELNNCGKVKNDKMILQLYKKRKNFGWEHMIK